MSYFIDFPNGHSATEEVEYGIELVQRYGTTLEANEYAEFVSETREQLIYEMERHIQANPVFADAGIYSYEDYERVLAQDTNTEVESKAIWTLLGEEADYVRFKLQALDWIDGQYRDYPQYLNRIISEAANQKAIDRYTEVLQTKEYTNIMDWNVYNNTVGYSLYLAILSVLAVLVLVSPLIVTDRARNVHLMQYTSRLGRMIFRKQLYAVLLSAFCLTTVLLLIFGAIYSTNSTWVYWNSGMISFLNRPIFWFDMTYGQYVTIYIGLLYILCLGTAAMAFILSRFSRNLITLLLKLIPVFAALATLCVYVFRYPFSMDNDLYRALGIIGLEPLVCCLLCIACVAVSIYLVRREKAAEVF
jgi:hypothetical protein